MSPPRRIVVIGAGAAGTMAAIWAARGGAEVDLLERTADGGRKILISGGGRCNILPSRLDERRFVTDSSVNTLRMIVRAWPLAEQIAFFERELALPLVEEPASAKLFPRSNRARDVRDGLLMEARRCGARYHGDTRVTGVRPEAGRWRVESATGESRVVDAVIMASGGLSVPATGSDGFGLGLAAQLGHTVHETYAALTPLTAATAPFAHLAGVSLPVAITALGQGRAARATGGFLFTHRGYSGPAVLDVSHVAVRAGSGGSARVAVSWGAVSEEEWERSLVPQGARTVGGAVRARLPERLAEALLARAGLDPALPLAQLRRDQRRAVLDQLLRCELPWTGHEGYRKAEVTGGGVSLAEIHPRTMESRRHPGLYLCGEVLDAFGPIGGYNFLWAWVTGRGAGVAAALQR